jgi:TolA-binding protein
MATKKSDAPKPIAEIEQGPSKFEQFLDANQRKLIALAVIVILGVLGFTAYRTIQRDNRHSAGAALVGADDLTTLLDVTKNHAGTPAAASAQLLAADAQWADGRQDDAIGTLREFIDQNPGHPARPTALASLGSRLMAQGKTGDARDTFNSLLEDPDASFLAPYALISLGDIARAEGKTDEAEAFLNRARDEYPDDNFSSVATEHLALLRSADPVEIDPPPPPVPEPPPSITRPDDEPDISKPIELDPTKMPGAGPANPLIPDAGTTPDPDAPGFNPTPPSPPPAPKKTPDEAPDAAAPKPPAEPAEPAEPAGDKDKDAAAQTAPEKPAPAKPGEGKAAPKEPVATEPAATGGKEQAEPAKETDSATETAAPERPESGDNE